MSKVVLNSVFKLLYVLSVRRYFGILIYGRHLKIPNRQGDILFYCADILLISTVLSDKKSF